MTIEEKAKAYDEALERAKKYHEEYWQVDAKDITETLFPQLRESEDERMLREFNDWLCDEIDFLTNELCDDKDRRTLEMLCYVLTNVKDWLGKRKEPTTEELYAEAGTTEKEYIANTMKMVRAMREKKQEQKPEDKEITLTNFEEVLNTFLFDFANSPIEDCEPKEYTKKHSAEILKAAYAELNAQLKQDIFEAQQEGRREGYEAAKAEQKPAEWSEEDEKMLQNLLECLRNGWTKLPTDVLKYESWLKSLRPQQKQEWDDGDEENIDSIIIILNKALSKGISCEEEVLDLTDWLKSIHPQPNQDCSEDERIRNGLIKVVSDIAGGWPFEKHRITKKEAITYLEKLIKKEK